MFSKLPFVVGVLLLTGCLRSDSHVVTQSDRLAAKETALAYMVQESPPPDGYCIAIADREDSEHLIAVLSGAATHCIGPVTEDEYGQSYDSNRLRVIHLAAEIISIDDRTATLTTELIAGPEGGAWYTVTLRKERNQWVIASARLDARS